MTPQPIPQINGTNFRPCDTCEGTGVDLDGDDCVECVGTGKDLTDHEWSIAYTRRTGPRHIT